MPAIGLGTWKSEKGKVGEAVKTAVRAGYRHIDCAPIYGNEAEIGEALAELFAEGEIKREDLWITSKLWNTDHKKTDVVPAIKRTLSDLQLDYLDLWLIHWPVALKPDVTFPDSGDDFLSLGEVPLTETWAGMEEAAKAGLTRNIGVSNFSIENLGTILEKGEMHPAVNQVELHPFLAQEELVKFCLEKNVRPTAYSPLGSGDRPRRMKKDDEPNLLEHPVIQAVAEKHDATTGQVLIRWAVERDTVVIPKSTNAGRIKENLAAHELRLDKEDMEQISALDAHYRIVDGSFWTPEGSPYTMEALWG